MLQGLRSAFSRTVESGSSYFADDRYEQEADILRFGVSPQEDSADFSNSLFPATGQTAFGRQGYNPQQADVLAEEPEIEAVTDVYDAYAGDDGSLSHDELSVAMNRGQEQLDALKRKYDDGTISADELGLYTKLRKEMSALRFIRNNYDDLDTDNTGTLSREEIVAATEEAGASDEMTDAQAA